MTNSTNKRVFCVIIYDGGKKEKIAVFKYRPNLRLSNFLLGNISVPINSHKGQMSPMKE